MSRSASVTAENQPTTIGVIRASATVPRRPIHYGSHKTIKTQKRPRPYRSPQQTWKPTRSHSFTSHSSCNVINPTHRWRTRRDGCVPVFCRETPVLLAAVVSSIHHTQERTGQRAPWTNIVKTWSRGMGASVTCPLRAAGTSHRFPRKIDTVSLNL